MSKKRDYEKAPSDIAEAIEQAEVIRDFLPPPDQLVLRGCLKTRVGPLGPRMEGVSPSTMRGQAALAPKPSMGRRVLADPALSRWRDALSRARDAQRVTRRDASYRHPTIEQVCRTLNGGTPANAADLAALVMDRLGEIARKIRGGPTSDWHQYWNVDQYNRPTGEKPEDACRDNLLSDLEPILITRRL